MRQHNEGASVSNLSDLHYVLDKARWAPSGDNSQPWQFKIVSPNTFEVWYDKDKSRNVYDLLGVANEVVQGALLETAAIAASERGLKLSVTDVFDQPVGAGYYRVTLEPATFSADPLAEFIESRHVQRRPMGTAPLSAMEKQALEGALPDDIGIYWLESWASRWATAKMIYKSAKTRLMMKEGYDVHAHIIDWGKRYSEDKIPEYALGVDFFSGKLMRWALKSWSRFEFMAKYLGGTILPRVQLDLIPALFCSAHYVLYTKTPYRPSFGVHANAGMALQRFWLTATQLNMGAQPEFTPIMFSHYIKHALVFSQNSEALRNAAEVDQDLARLLPKEVFDNKVFMGRIGRHNGASSRSLRKPLKQLLF